MILHVIPDSDDPHALVAKVMDALPPGSYLAVSHLGADLLDQEAKQGFEDVVSRTAQQQYIGRSREQMARFFDGHGPGRARTRAGRGMAPRPWAGETGRSALWCAVGRKSARPA